MAHQLQTTEGGAQRRIRLRDPNNHGRPPDLIVQNALA